MIFKQVPVWSHSISEAAMEKFGSTAAGRAVSSGNSTWRTITGACRDEALHRCGSMWGHSLQQMPLDRARMVRMIQNDSEWLLSAILHLENACGIDKVPSSSKFIQVPDCGDPGFGHRDSKPTTYMCGHVHLYLPRWSIISFLYPICIVCFLYCVPLHFSNICQNLCILSAWSLRAFFHIESGPGSPFISKQHSRSQVFSAHLDPRIFD